MQKHTKNKDLPMWDERYSSDDFVYGTEPNVWVRECTTAIPEGGRVLCLADGEGRNGVWLAEQGFQVTSVDLSEVGLAKARRLAERRNVELNTVCADLSSWDLGQGWDAIVSVFAHMPVDGRQELHARIPGSLSDDGVFILEAYTPAQLEGSGKGGPPRAELMMTVESLRDELTELRFDVLENTTYDIDEGAHHTGDAHVVRVLARR